MTIVSPSWAAFRVSVEPLQAGNGLSYVVCLDRGDRPVDAEPWADGRITPVNRNNVEEANFAAQEWADFLGVTFTPCEPVLDTRETAGNTVPEYGKYPVRKPKIEQPENPEWIGCGECDFTFPCHRGCARCIRVPNAIPPQTLISTKTREVWCDESLRLAEVYARKKSSVIQVLVTHRSENSLVTACREAVDKARADLLAHLLTVPEYQTIGTK